MTIKYHKFLLMSKYCMEFDLGTDDESSCCIGKHKNYHVAAGVVF